MHTDDCLNLRPLPVAAAVLLLLGGCAATTTPRLDAQLGERTRQLGAQQLIDPAAPTRHAGAMPRTDGRTLRDGVERHGEGWRSPPPSNVINIGVGGSR